MFGQVALAAHSATHIDHGISHEVIALQDQDGNHENNHEHQKKKHDCPECVLTKSLQTAFYNTPALISVYSGMDVSPLSSHFNIFVEARYKAHSPRAPPAILI